MAWLKYLHKLMSHHHKSDMDESISMNESLRSSSSSTSSSPSSSSSSLSLSLPLSSASSCSSSSYIFSSLLLTSSELVQLRRLNMANRRDKELRRGNNNTRHRCHRGRVTIIKKHHQQARQDKKQKQHQSTNKKSSSIAKRCQDTKTRSSHTVMLNRDCHLVTSEKFTKIKNPIITINKNSFRTNNHFGVGNHQPSHFNPHHHQHHHHHQSMGRILLQPIAESSVNSTKAKTIALTSSSTSSWSTTTNKRNRSHDCVDEVVNASLCTSCVRVRADLNRRRYCKCCGKDLVVVRRRAATSNATNKRRRCHQLDENSRENFKKQQLQHHQHQLGRVHFQQQQQQQQPQRSIHDCHDRANLMIGSNRLGGGVNEPQVRVKKPCLKKYIATVNTQAIEKYREAQLQTSQSELMAMTMAAAEVANIVTTFSVDFASTPIKQAPKTSTPKRK